VSYSESSGRSNEATAARRTSGDFWSHSDRLHQAYRRAAPIDSGLFDDNRLENR